MVAHHAAEAQRKAAEEAQQHKAAEEAQQHKAAEEAQQRKAAEEAQQRKAAEEAQRKAEAAARVVAEVRASSANRVAPAQPSPAPGLATTKAGRPARHAALVVLAGLAGLLLLLVAYNFRPVEETTEGKPAPAAAEPTAQATPSGRTSYLSYPYGHSWADAPTIDPSPSGWWCICYKTNLGVNNTACRRIQRACEDLRTMIQERGSSAIQKDSAASGPCRHFAGSYPWEQLGHRDAWKESAYSDASGVVTEEQRTRRRATQAAGVCAL
jgi:hypothetical protein